MDYSLEFKNQVVNEYLSGSTTRQVSGRFKIDRKTVSRWVKEMAGDASLRPANGHPKELRERVIKEYLSGVTSPELAKQYNIDAKTITVWVRKSSNAVRNTGTRPLFLKQTLEEKKEKGKKKYPYTKKWIRDHPEKSKQYYLQRTSTVNVEQRRAYYRTEARKVKTRENYKKRYQNDINFRLRLRLRSRFKSELKTRGIKKETKTLILLGCSLAFFRKYIEGKFTDGMSWGRLDEIHLDHIRPCASFDLTDPEQQKQCFHYTNIQPLWARDNFEKGAKWEYH